MWAGGRRRARDGGHEDRRGALTLYADGATAFHEPAHEVALVVAAHLTILMARRGLGAEEALAVLRRASVRTNTRLHQVAARVVDEHGAAERD